MIEQTIIVGLAGWRLASMIVFEEGPSEVFERLRRWAGVPDEGEIVGFFPKLLACIWCVTVWTTALFLVLWYVWWLIPGLFAMAAVALFAERAVSEMRH